MTTTADYPAAHPDRITEPARIELHDGHVTAAPDHGTIEISQLLGWARHHRAAVLVSATDACPGTCAGHLPLAPDTGEHLVLGRRDPKTPGRVVYRVVRVQPTTLAVDVERVA